MEPADPQEPSSLGEILHPPGYRPPLLHFALVFTELLGRVPPLLLTPAWLALAAIACWPWEGLRAPAAGLSLVLTLVDGLGLALLPRLGRSFGPVTPPLLALAVLRTGITFTVGLAWGTLPALIAVAAFQLSITAAVFYATWIEPFRIGVTHTALRSAKLDGEPPLRLLHVSDLHIEAITPRERRLLDLITDLEPDVIVLTGDYLNLSSVRDPDAHADARRLLTEVCQRSPGPVYGITGSPPVDLEGIVPDIFASTDVRWLLDEVVTLNLKNQTICLAGLRCSRERSQAVPRLRRLLADVPEELFTLLLYHSPDLMPEAVDLGVDLYLCGHTHGGQLRLPLFGALVTSSAFWKRYEMGRYVEEETTLYVSRGLGMEGLGAPRARFLSPPEIILWSLSGD